MKSTKFYTELLSQALSPDKFCAAAAEEYAKADRNLRKAFANDCADEIFAAVQQMLLAASAYTTALRQQGLNRDYTAVLLLTLLNTDMSGVAPTDVAHDLMEIHSAFFMQLGQLNSFYEDDEFALPHIRCITYMEAAIYEHLATVLAPQLAGSRMSLTTQGLAEAARDLLSTAPPEGCIPVAPLEIKTLLIDIFSRFNALGYF